VVKIIRKILSALYIEMVKLTKAQKAELEVWRYFIPSNCAWLPQTDDDIKMFFEWSEQGKHKDITIIPTYKSEGRTYFHALYWGKKWAGIHMHELWEPGVLDGTMPYFTLLCGYENNKRWWQFWKSPNKPIPRYIVDFMKKEMFKGIDSEIIENCYQNLTKTNIISSLKKKWRLTVRIAG
jgi:hypothetical protein